ncbi:MAG TPA: hypothetical protein PK047_06300 [Saprospiraceae bacterium]|jgi:hypothetical protein|nr:hypothetical protein [Saprospiraceae bacterium]HRO08461.1 hypothetical protein [Saprospiraceae bacterium]HRP41846.1 hypothetical protein [Saprospiraceae bacterium]
MNQFDNMRKLILDFVKIGLIILMTPISIRAQLFETNELYPNINVKKGKYFNGSGGGGYWSLEYVDSIGRIISKESYRKKKLMSRQKIVLDDNNNTIYDIHTFDFNNPDRVDTFRYEYKYSNNRIIYQFSQLSENDSTVIKLIENQGDTLLKYQEQAFHYRPKTKMTDIYETVYTLKYQNGQLIREEAFDKEQNSTEIKNYEYYDNGRLKRRRIERIPKLKDEPVYLGGPGSDNELYKYKLDSEGRIKTLYRIINGKKYKIAVYSYK